MLVIIQNMSNRTLLLSLMEECKKGTISEAAKQMFVEALLRLEGAEKLTNSPAAGELGVEKAGE